MYKSKIIIDEDILNQISNSFKMGDDEKITFLKYVGYLTKKEKEELSHII